MKFPLLYILPFGFAQLDFSVYEDVVYVKTNSVPEEIQKALSGIPDLDYKEIKKLSYPQNIIRETNILNHLYDNYWTNYAADPKLTEVCSSSKSDFLDHLTYIYKLPRQFLKNLHNITRQNGKCRVCDPIAYWFRQRLEEYTGPFPEYSSGKYNTNGASNIIMDVNRTFVPLREISRTLELSEQQKCIEVTDLSFDIFRRMLSFFYQTFLKNNLPCIPDPFFN